MHTFTEIGIDIYRYAYLGIKKARNKQQSSTELGIRN